MSHKQPGPAVIVIFGAGGDLTRRKLLPALYNLYLDGWLPVETVVRHRQKDYYAQLAQADASSDCSGFIDFMLQAIADALREEVATRTRVETREEKRV